MAMPRYAPCALRDKSDVNSLELSDQSVICEIIPYKDIDIVYDC